MERLRVRPGESSEAGGASLWRLVLDRRRLAFMPCAALLFRDDVVRQLAGFRRPAEADQQVRTAASSAGFRRTQCLPDSLPWYLWFSVSTFNGSPTLMNSGTLMTRPQESVASL